MRNFFCKIKVMQAKELFNTRHIHIFPILLLRKIIAVTDASFCLPLSTLVSAQVQSFNLMALLFLLLRINYDSVSGSGCGNLLIVSPLMGRP